MSINKALKYQKFVINNKKKNITADEQVRKKWTIEKRTLLM